MAEIEVKSLYKIFGKNPGKALKLLKEGKSKENILEISKQVVGLNNISFSINTGEIFVVMGLSGSGKSTLIRCLNRLIEPTSGEIVIDGQDITKMNHTELLHFRRAKMGMVFQSFALLPHINVLDNAAFGLKIQGVAAEERREKAAIALEKVGLSGWESSFPEQLSGGMQQRVGLARALANDPDILLLDEAFSALDPLIRRDMQDQLIELQNELNKTLVFITHDLDEALKLGDRIALMKDGNIVQIGNSEEILMTPASGYVARFVEDVDKTRVLTAAQVMKKPDAVIYIKDGPRVAMLKMKEYGISSIFVIDRFKKLQGLLTADKAAEAIGMNATAVSPYLQKDVTKVSPDTRVNEMFDLMAESQGPVAVTNENEELKGIIVRGSILAGLAGGYYND